MSKHKDRSRELRADISDNVDDPPNSAAPTNGSDRWSKTKTRLVSLLLLGFLFVLVLGPLSNPIASPYLSGPIAAKVSPVHRALFLGHGYRFFGPDPGPGHLLVYQGERSDGSRFEGVFPDSSEHWPRLLYHRWFMLSETIFSEYALQPSEAEFEQRVAEYKLQIAEFQETGKLKFANELMQERDLEALQYQDSRKRVELLGRAVAEVLAKRNEASSINLFLQVRQIPLAEVVASGVKIDDPELLSALLPVGQLDSSGYKALSPYATGLPTNGSEEILPGLEVSQ